MMNLLANKMRSLLTMVGIIIGISSVIMIISIGNGFKISVSDSFSQMGMDGLEVMLRDDKAIKNSDYFTKSDITLLKRIPDVKYVAPVTMNTGSVNLKRIGDTKSCLVWGTNDELKFAHSINILSGRFLLDKDIINQSSVAVIDSDLSKQIFGREDSTGEKIKVKFLNGSLNLTIVGIYKSENASIAAFNMPAYIYVPYTTLLSLSTYANLEDFFVTAYDKDKLDLLSTEIVRLLEVYHHTSDKYYTRNFVEQMDSMSNTLNMITTFVIFVAAISLLVGGIGVMNIMLVTVTERTRKIGIRKSLGATNSNIKFQFLVETVIITMIGGIIGIVLGYLGGIIIGKIVNITPSFSIGAIMVTVLISSAIGIIFGVYPAGKAAKLNPIEALRYE